MHLWPKCTWEKGGWGGRGAVVYFPSKGNGAILCLFNEYCLWNLAKVVAKIMFLFYRLLNGNGYMFSVKKPVLIEDCGYASFVNATSILIFMGTSF